MSATNQMLFRRATEAESERDAAISRLEAAEAVVAAVRAAGPWPRIDATAIGKCFDCFWPTWERGHDPNCKGLAIMHALAALDAEGRGGES